MSSPSAKPDPYGVLLGAIEAAMPPRGALDRLNDAASCGSNVTAKVRYWLFIAALIASRSAVLTAKGLNVAALGVWIALLAGGDPAVRRLARQLRHKTKQPDYRIRGWSTAGQAGGFTSDLTTPCRTLDRTAAGTGHLAGGFG